MFFFLFGGFFRKKLQPSGRFNFFISIFVILPGNFHCFLKRVIVSQNFQASLESVLCWTENFDLNYSVWRSNFIHILFWTKFRNSKNIFLTRSGDSSRYQIQIQLYVENIEIIDYINYLKMIVFFFEIHYLRIINVRFIAQINHQTHTWDSWQTRTHWIQSTTREW